MRGGRYRLGRNGACGADASGGSIVAASLELRSISSTGDDAGRDAICPCVQWQFGQPGGHSLPLLSSGQFSQQSARSSDPNPASTATAAAPDSCTASIRMSIRSPHASTSSALRRGVVRLRPARFIDLRGFTAPTGGRQAEVCVRPGNDGTNGGRQPRKIGCDEVAICRQRSRFGPAISWIT